MRNQATTGASGTGSCHDDGFLNPALRQIPLRASKEATCHNKGSLRCIDDTTTEFHLGGLNHVGRPGSDMPAGRGRQQGPVVSFSRSCCEDFAACVRKLWEFPKRRGPNMDPNIL